MYRPINESAPSDALGLPETYLHDELAGEGGTVAPHGGPAVTAIQVSSA